jgi:hypothetical protein
MVQVVECLTIARLWDQIPVPLKKQKNKKNHYLRQKRATLKKWEPKAEEMCVLLPATEFIKVLKTKPGWSPTGSRENQLGDQGPPLI